jgi:hypothetical protein
MSKHLLGIGAENEPFEPPASVRAQDNEVLFQLFGVFGDAPWHITLRDLVYVDRNIESPGSEILCDRCQITLGVRDILEVSVTMYAARRTLLDHVEKFNRAPESFRKPLYDWENRFREF